MNPELKAAITRRVETEPFARLLGMQLVSLASGRAVVEMIYAPDKLNNIQGRAHGGALYALMDEALEAAAHTNGTRCAALNATITYVSSPPPGSRLRAEARQLAVTRKTASYEARITDESGAIVALGQALAYRTNVSFMTSAPDAQNGEATQKHGSEPDEQMGPDI